MDLIQDTSILLSFFGWIYIFFFHGKGLNQKQDCFWSNKVIFENNFLHKKKSKKKNSAICAILPARNEEKFIGKTLESLINQKIGGLDIILINDNSSDKTVQLAEKIINKKNFKKFKILNGKSLPKGWSGKVWALKQGVDLANKKKYKYFLFLDSDIILKKKLIARVRDFMNENNLTMVSLMAKLKCESFWEKLLIPSFIFFFQKIYPFSEVNNPKSNKAAAAGGFIFCKSNIFEKKNLYVSIKNKVIDDCNLARLVKQKGNIWLGLTDSVESQRSYKYLSEIWKMISRTAFEQLNYSIIKLSFSIIGLFILYVSPILNTLLLDLTKHNFKIFANIITLLMMIFAIKPTIIFYKLNLSYCLSLPLSSIMYSMMTISSAFNYFFKNGNIWKGRKY